MGIYAPLVTLDDLHEVRAIAASLAADDAAAMPLFLRIEKEIQQMVQVQVVARLASGGIRIERPVISGSVKTK